MIEGRFPLGGALSLQWIFGVTAASAVLLYPGGASAKGPLSVRECADVAQHVQSARAEGHLRAARSYTLACSQDDCPTVIRRDCEAWLSQIDESLPTAVVRAVDATDHDLVEVRVTMDGELLMTRLDGIAIPLDPGAHRFAYSVAGQPTVVEEILIAQGEKNRRILVRFPARRPPQATPPTPTEESRSSSGFGPAFWTAAGVGGAALASFGYFGLSALSKRSDLASSCAPKHTCSAGDHDTLQTRAILADVSLGVALVAAGLAVFFAWNARTTSNVALVPGGGFTTWSVTY